MEIIQLKKENFDIFYHMRMMMFEALGEVNDTIDLEELEEVSKKYFAAHIGKDMFSWGVLVDGKIASIASMCLFTRLPYPGNLEGKEGHVLGVFTLPEFRRKGMAETLTRELVAYAEENGIKRLWLKNSDEAKSVYLKCGFKEKSNEMERYCN